MKNIKFIFIYFLFISNIEAQTNVYHPFPDTNAIWCETSFYLLHTYIECPSIAYLAGDTTINNIKYKILLANQNCFGLINRGGIRQDTINKTVYFCIPNTTTDTLLYNFNLHVGDTLPITYNNSGYNYVASIDSVLVGPTYRKRYNIHNGSSSNGCSLIEGIGSTKGLLYPLNGALGYSFILNCFSNAGQIVYPYSPNTNEGYCCAQLLTEVITVYNETAITIYPNPASDKIEVSSRQNEVSNIEIYNLLGEIIYAYPTADYLSPITINVADIPNGVYFMQVKTSEGIFTKKVIIQR